MAGSRKRPYKPEENERDFMKRVITWAVMNGWLVCHISDRPPNLESFDFRQFEVGFPDLVMTRDGVLIFAELKSQKGRIQKTQQLWIDALREVEVHAMDAHDFFWVRTVIWRPADWPEIEKLLARGPA